jgi:hypothetical protein
VLLAAWLEARSDWGRALRRYIAYRSDALTDSPARLIAAIESGREGGTTAAAYRRWQAVAKSVEPKKVTHWISDEEIKCWADWVRRRFDRAILWYTSQAVEQRLQAWGWDVRGSGSLPPPDSVDHPACSVRVHGEGQNLQAWSRAVLLEPPSSGRAWEQVLGRLHRPLQVEPVLYLWRADYWPHRAAYVQAETFARYTHQSTGKTPKLLHAQQFSLSAGERAWLTRVS